MSGFGNPTPRPQAGQRLELTVRISLRIRVWRLYWRCDFVIGDDPDA